MSANQNQNQNNKPSKWECSCFNIYHFCMLLSKELSKEEAKELLDHVAECKQCSNCLERINKIHSLEYRLSRKKQLDFLAFLANPLWTMEFDSLVERTRSKIHKDLKAIEVVLKQIKRASKAA